MKNVWNDSDIVRFSCYDSNDDEMMQLKFSIVAGSDNIVAEHVRYAVDAICDTLTSCFNM